MASVLIIKRKNLLGRFPGHNGEAGRCPVFSQGIMGKKKGKSKFHAAADEDAKFVTAQALALTANDAGQSKDVGMGKLKVLGTWSGADAGDTTPSSAPLKTEYSIVIVGAGPHSLAALSALNEPLSKYPLGDEYVLLLLPPIPSSHPTLSWTFPLSGAHCPLQMYVHIAWRACVCTLQPLSCNETLRRS